MLLLVMGSRHATRHRVQCPGWTRGTCWSRGCGSPSTSIEEGTAYSGALERALLGLPEVTTVVSKMGRPDLATEAMGTYESDSYVNPGRPERGAPPGGRTPSSRPLDSALSTIPGLEYAFTQPIQMRLDEAESGKSPPTWV